MDSVPSGRTSSVNTAEKTFILQTEFKLKPKTSIVTSVSLDGQVVHRVERAFTRPVDIDQGWLGADSAIKSQHNALARKILANGKDFIRQTKSIKVSQLDKLNLVPGIAYIADIEEKLQSDDPQTIYIQSKLILDIAGAISRNSRSGELKTAAVLTDQGKYVLNKTDGKGHLLSLKPNTEIGQILKEIREL